MIADADGCTLRFSETVEDASWGARNAAGWEMCLESLATILQGGTVVKFAWDVWRTKFDHYVRKFESLEAEAPPIDADTMAYLVAHERAQVTFATREAEGDAASSIEPVLALLSDPPEKR